MRRLLGGAQIPWSLDPSFCLPIGNMKDVPRVRTVLHKAIVWFRHQPVPALGSKCPWEPVQRGDPDVVLSWLDALEDGAYG
jgi:hypothetical protein